MIVQLALLGSTVKPTLMIVQEPAVKILIISAMMVLILIPVAVPMGSLEINVRPTLMSVNQILASMVELVRMESIAISVHAERDLMEAIVSFNYFTCNYLYILHHEYDKYCFFATISWLISW